MRKVFVVAWREFKHTVMRRIFIIAILGIPLMIVALGGVAIFIFSQHREPPLIGTVVVIEETGEVAEAAAVEFDEEKIRSDELREAQRSAEGAIRGELPQGGFGPGSMPVQRGEVRIEIESLTDTSEHAIEAAKERLRAEDDIIAVAVVRQEVLEAADPAESEPADAPNSSGTSARERERERERTTFELTVAENADSDHISLIERRLGESIVRVRAHRVGYEPEQVLAMLRPPEARTSRALAGGEEASASEGFRELRAQIVPMAFMMLIWIGVLSSSQHLMMSTIEEKSNRVMEVLLSAVSPLQLMTGKIVGYGAVGLLIVAIYASLAIVGLIALAAFSNFLHWSDLLYLAVFYLMAYFMIASLMAAVGSAVSDIREANTLVTPVMMILMVPLMLWYPILQAPNGPVAVIFSYIPPAAPFAMILRLAAEEPVPPLQIATAIAWGFLCVLIMIWAAARIFRVGVLMTGKPPSPFELVKWIRYA